MSSVKRKKLLDQEDLLKRLIVVELSKREQTSTKDLNDTLSPWEEAEIAVALGALLEEGAVSKADYGQGPVWRLSNQTER